MKPLTGPRSRGVQRPGPAPVFPARGRGSGSPVRALARDRVGSSGATGRRHRPEGRAMTLPAPKAATWTYAESFVAEDDLLAAARARAEEVGAVAIGSGGGAALRFLASVIEARAVVEIRHRRGRLGALAAARDALDGVLTTIDIEAEHQRLARESYNDAGIPPQRARTIAGAALDVLPGSPTGTTTWSSATATRRSTPPTSRGPAPAASRRDRGVRQRPLARPVADPSQRDEETSAIREARQGDRGQRVAGAAPAVRR